MRTLKMRNGKFEFMLAMAAILLIFSAPLKAETADADTEAAPAQTEAAPVKEEETLLTLSAESSVAAMSSASSQQLPPISPSAIGGAFSSLMSESFKTDLATGAATLSIPIVVPPGRKNVQPNVALSYSSNNPNGICGVGWSIPVSAIQRSTKDGVPRYNSVDDFVAGGEELVYIEGNEYMAKMESSFTKYTYVSAEDKWVAYDKSGAQYHFGSSAASRMQHPTNPSYIFAWYLDKVVDLYGNTMTYTYKYIDTDEGAYLYPESINYTSNDTANPALTADKKVEFVYETGERPDRIYNRRSGWPTTMKRRLEKIKVYRASNLVWTYTLSYIPSPDTSRSLLKSIQLSDSAGATLPAKTFTYQRLEP